MKILFVCLGNICRSPLAQAIAQKYNQDHEFDSAGISGYHRGSPPCKGSQWVAREHNIPIMHITSRPVRYPKDDHFDLILALDTQNYQDLLAMGFEAHKVRKLGEFGFDGLDVPDPYYYTGMEGFERVYSMIETCVLNLIKEINDSSLGH
ncbi:low molecular weight protein-tyrosine-phosphatase [Helicobacter pametensis]|uniref:low molecular weight protein-tyrosine-phosphatase n=1 Tax=Helicobacter pametensis TaxID=95149 RepID=UPI000482E145|nr:low molecular weight protein-tyrosine-phosphatase [Helicobacter pametensis]